MRVRRCLGAGVVGAPDGGGSGGEIPRAVFPGAGWVTVLSGDRMVLEFGEGGLMVPLDDS